MDSHRPGVTDFVHVGLVVEDLDETVRFLALLGFDCGKPGVFSGDWIDRIIGLEDVTVEVVMARGPDGSDMFEVVRFHSPSAGAQEPAPAVTTQIQRNANGRLCPCADRPAVLRIPLAVLAVAGAPLIASCSYQAANGGRAPTGQVRADTLAGVAKRIYRQEVRGEVGHAAVKRIARDHALLAALSTGNRTALRAAALRQLFDPGKHVVRLSIVRRGRTLTNVGGAFVVAPAMLDLHTPAGADLGRIEASMQDVIGYVKLVRRLTGAQIVVRGQPGHVESSLAATPAVLPASGTTTVAGLPYVVRSFRETGFAGERLTVWILTPATSA